MLASDTSHESCPGTSVLPSSELCLNVLRPGWWVFWHSHRASLLIPPPVFTTDVHLFVAWVVSGFSNVKCHWTQRFSEMMRESPDSVSGSASYRASPETWRAHRWAKGRTRGQPWRQGDKREQGPQGIGGSLAGLVQEQYVGVNVTCIISTKSGCDFALCTTGVREMTVGTFKWLPR